MICSLYFYCYNRNKIKNSLIITFVLLLINIITFVNLELKDHLIFSVLITTSIIDYQERIIPNIFIFILLLTSLFSSFPALLIYDYITIFLLLMLTVLSFRTNYIGMGDVKLLMVLYMLKGVIFFHQLIFVLSFIIFIFSMFLYLRNRNIKMEFPLIPFILISFIVVRSLI